MAYEGQLRVLERSTIGREHFSSVEVGSLVSSGIPQADSLLRNVQKKNPLRAHIGWIYLDEMERSLKSLRSILRQGGTLLMVAGPNTICGHQFQTPRFLEKLAHRNGFATRFKLVDHIRSRGLMTKRNKTAGLIMSESVLCLTRQ
jgi:hypothetical protein